MAFPIPLPSRSVYRFETWKAAWSGRHRHVPTVLAPALPALILLAITTAGMTDPPRGALVTQLHLTKTAATCSTGSVCPAWTVTPR